MPFLPQIIYATFEPNSRNSKERAYCSTNLCKSVNPSFPRDIRTWHSVCTVLAVFAPARVCMRMPRNITNELSPSEKPRCLWNILTAPSSWKILRHSLPLGAVPPRPTITPHKRMLHGKNMQMTKLPGSEPHSKAISRILDGCAAVDQFHSEYQQRAPRKPLAHFDATRGTD